MKTKLVEKNESFEVKCFEQLSQSEMKEINGGLRMVAIRDEDGNVRIVFVP